MITLIWRKYNYTRDIEIEIDENTPIRIVRNLVERLVGGDYRARLQPPRGRRVILYFTDAEDLEYPPNPAVTGWAGKHIFGDAVIVTPDLWRKLDA
jgi:hypothetical protein